MIERILDSWYRATAEDLEAGADWYPAAKRAARRISYRTGVPHRRVVRVIAAVSPRTRWARNLEVAALVCAGEPVTGVFSRSLERAALAVAGGNNLFDPVTAPKTLHFDAAIWGDDDAVAVDYISGTLALGPEAFKARHLERVGVYGLVVRAYRTAARTAGTTPRVMQSTTWGIERGAHH